MTEETDIGSLLASCRAQRVQSGDVVLLQTDRVLSQRQADQIRARLSEAMPNNESVIVAGNWTATVRPRLESAEANRAE